MTTISNDTTRQIKSTFDSDGYVVIRNFLTGRELEKLRGELSRYIQNRLSEIPHTDALYEDRSDSSTLKQLAHMRQHDSYFSDLIEAPQWAELARTLLDDQVVPQEIEWFNKPPNVSKPTPPHQDGYYFMLEPNDAVTMWLALDPVDEANGCLRYIPGSHLLGLRPHARTETLGFSQGISDYTCRDLEAEVPIKAEPGDLLVHHAITVHRADSNRSERHRRSLGLIYYAARSQAQKEKLSQYQQQLYAEWKAAQKI